MDGEKTPHPPTPPLPLEGCYRVDRRHPRNIIVDPLFAISSQMLGPTALKKEANKKKFESSLGTIVLIYVFTQLWLIVSGVVYSGRVVAITITILLLKYS